MESIEIKGSIRKNIGKNFTKQIREDGQVPCCLYGGKENINFQSHELSFKNLIYTPHVYLVNLEIEGTKYNAVLQDIQFHPVTDRIMHIDFMEIIEGKKVKIGIPVKLTGDSEGIKQGGKFLPINVFWLFLYIFFLPQNKIRKIVFKRIFTYSD